MVGAEGVCSQFLDVCEDACEGGVGAEVGGARGVGLR